MFRLVDVYGEPVASRMADEIERSFVDCRENVNVSGQGVGGAFLRPNRLIISTTNERGDPQTLKCSALGHETLHYVFFQVLGASSGPGHTPPEKIGPWTDTIQTIANEMTCRE